jgi:PAS domain S-box-containing protein
MDSHVSAPNREGLLDRVFHGSLAGMVVARLDDGVIVEANDAFCALAARGLGELLGSNLDDVGLWGEFGPDRARAQLRETGLIDGYDTTLTSLQGEARIVRVWAEVVNGGEPLVVIRASDVDGRATAKSRYRELREAEVRFRAMVEQIPAIIYTEVDDPDSPTGCRTIYVSPQTLPLLGIEADDWVADPAAWLAQIHPEDRERVLADLDRVTHGRYENEYRMISADGRVVWFRDEAAYVEDPASGMSFWQGVMTDITATREAAEHHAETQAKYRSLVEQLPAVVYLAEYGEEGAWLYISPQIERIHGLTPEEWLAHPGPAGTFTHPEDLPKIRAEEERSFRTGEPFRAEYRMRRNDGGWVWILDEASVVRGEDGTPLFMQGLMYDITERKEAEERLVALDRLKNTLLHTLSHDLKGPLTAILGAASTLERLDAGLDPEERTHLLRTMVDRTKGMNAFLTDLLDLDRLDRGIIEPRRFPVDLVELVRNLVARTGVLRDRAVEVEGVRCMSNVDSTKVERIVENLLANAARHTPVGPIWVRVWCDETGATIAVEDEGPGIPDDLKAEIFEAFRRGAGDVESSGSGIGLSLVARFAEVHGGRAWVEDRRGGGASFRVFLPDQPRNA